MSWESLSFQKANQKILTVLCSNEFYDRRMKIFQISKMHKLEADMYCEKAAKFEKNLPLFLELVCT